MLKATIPARAALAGLDQAAQRLPNPSMLIYAVSLLEAQASSEVENIVTTTDDLFQTDAHVERTESTATKETLQYRTALYSGLESLKHRPLTFQTARQVCGEIIGRPMDARNLPGTYIGDSHTGEPRYTPPFGEAVLAKKISQWERFMHGEHGLDPLVVMAAGHYQFEAIHPFTDGNGRTGRILNILFLISSGLLRYPVLYLSRHLIQHKNTYYDRLLAVTKDDDWESWLIFMLQGVEETATETLQLIDSIESLQNVLHRELRNHSSRGNADLHNLLFEKPYARISDVTERCGVSRPTATKWLEELVEKNFLTQTKIGRERLFINHQFLQILKQ